MRDQLSEKTSALFQSVFCLGIAVATLLGGQITGLVGFRTSCDVMAILALLTAIANFVVVYLYKPLQKDDNELPI